MRIDLIWIEIHLPGLPGMLAGFVLIDLEAAPPRVEVSLHEDWRFIPTEEDREVFAGMEDYIRSVLGEDLEQGLSILEEASNSIRFSERLRLVGPAVDASTLSKELRRLLLSVAGGNLTISGSA